MKEIEVFRSGGRYALAELSEKYKKYGLIVLKGYFEPGTKEEIRSILTARLDDAKERGEVLKLNEYPSADFLLGDVLSIRGLEKYEYIFFGQELVEIAKRLLQTDALVYYGDSSTQFDAAARGFHKDNVERKDATTGDWKGDYGLIRCAFYAEDHSRHPGGLKVRLSSHNLDFCRSRSDATKIDHNLGKAIDVKSEYGDVVIWSMRLTHSGNFRKLKWFRGVCLHPRFEMMLPDSLAVKEELRRYFLSCAFASPGSHLDRYIENMLVRDADYRQYLERARNATAARAYLAQRGVEFRQPCDFYGRLDDVG